MQFGYIVLTTSAGIMDHEEARRKNVGGKVLGFFYWREYDESIRIFPRTHLSLCFFVWIECLVKILECVMYLRNLEPCYELCLPLIIMTYLPILNFPSGHHKGTLNFFLHLNPSWIVLILKLFVRSTRSCEVFYSCHMTPEPRWIRWVLFPGCEPSWIRRALFHGFENWFMMLCVVPAESKLFWCQFA